MTEEPADWGRLAPQGPEDARLGEPVPADPPQIRNDLWTVYKAFDDGPEGNLKIWEEALAIIDGFCKMVEALDNDALMAALPDCRNRAREEVRRAQSELEMRREWAKKQLSRLEAWS